MIKRLQESSDNRQELVNMCDKLYGNDSIYPNEGLFGTMTNENITKAIEALKFLNDWYI